MTLRKIYVVTELSSGRQYVGQTKRDDRKGHGLIIENKYRKYGEDAFNYEVLKDRLLSQNLVNYLEKFYIKVLDTLHPNGLNLATGGHGGGTDNPEIGAKISATLRANYQRDPSIGIRISKSLKGRPCPWKGKTLTEEWKKKISASGKGRVVSEETCKKVSAAQKGKIIPEDQKLKMSEAAKRRANTPEGRAMMKRASMIALEKRT